MGNNNKKKSKKRWIIISAAVVVLAIIVLANVMKSDTKTIQVTTGKVKKGDITSIVTATGKVKAKTEIKISANVVAKIIKLPVREGDAVSKGRLLVQLDSDRYQAAVDQSRAQLASAKAQFELVTAQNEEARLAFERSQKMYAGKLISDEAFDAVRTRYDVTRAQLNSAQHAVTGAEASLREAQNQLDYTTITSPIDGVVTALNTEEGEIVMMGTMNNPGTVIMTVSDLSEIEVEVDVDETDVANVALAQEVKVSLDALPDTTFPGKVTEVGNSGRTSGFGSQDQVTNFPVTVLMTQTSSSIRPGMSATCDITTAEQKDILEIPIGAIVLRDEKDIKEKHKALDKTSGGVNATETGDSLAAKEQAADKSKTEKKKELEGVFVVRNGRAYFTGVKTGIADQLNMEIVSGLNDSDEIVTGSFKVLRELNHGDHVKISKSAEAKEDEKK